MVAASAKPLGEADRELALAAEVGDRLAQFLDAGEAARLVTDLDIEAGDARIVGGLGRLAVAGTIPNVALAGGATATVTIAAVVSVSLGGER